MKNKVQASVSLKKQFLFFLFLSCGLAQAMVYAQTKKTGREVFSVKPVPGELIIRQKGSEILLYFPRTYFRSALKIINTNGAIMKAVMIDEGIEVTTVSIIGMPKGVYQCVIENRTQRFVKKLLIQ